MSSDQSTRVPAPHLWKPGQSGNPSGRARNPKPQLKQLLQPLEAVALENIKTFLSDRSNKPLQWEVTKYVIERLHGKLKEQTEISGPDGGAIQIEDTTVSVADLLRQALQPMVVDMHPVEPVTIDVDPDIADPGVEDDADGDDE